MGNRAPDTPGGPPGRLVAAGAGLRIAGAVASASGRPRVYAAAVYHAGVLFSAVWALWKLAASLARLWGPG